MPYEHSQVTTSADHADPGLARRAARALIAHGLTRVPDAEAPAMASDIAEALGVIHTPPPDNPPRRHGQ